MTTITLESLRLEHFKGIADFTFTPGAITTVLGENGTGKTTLLDAWLWLLFDKDSQGAKAFEIKTLDAEGRTEAEQEHAVEATIAVNGQRLTLRKVLTEKWTKKRGSAQAEFTGHTTDYWIDGVPMKAKEYQAALAAFADPLQWLVLTDPRAFNESLSWQERRAILLPLGGMLSLEEIVELHPEFAGLPDLLAGRTVDQYRKVLAAERTQTRKALDEIPARIDEARRSVGDLADTEAAAQAAVDEARAQAEAAATVAREIRAEDPRVAIERQWRAAEQQCAALVREYEARWQSDRQTAQLTANGARQTVEAADRQLAALGADIRRWTARRLEATTEADRLRAQWQARNAETFEAPTDLSCPTCHQALPPDEADALIADALQRWNRAKAQDLTAIAQRGKGLKAEVADLETQIQQASTTIERVTAERTEAERTAQDAAETIARCDAALQQEPRSEAYQQAVAQRDALARQLAHGAPGVDPEAVRLAEAAVVEADTRLGAALLRLAAVQQIGAVQARIADLKAQEKTLAATWEQIEARGDLLDRYLRTQVRLVEDRLNARFTLARWTLFKPLINGGWEDACECTVRGVPYPSLNHALRVQVGMDIQRVLASAWELTVPTWIDAAESVTQLPPTPGQRIALTVSAADPQLRVTTTNEEVHV